MTVAGVHQHSQQVLAAAMVLITATSHQCAVSALGTVNDCTILLMLAWSPCGSNVVDSRVLQDASMLPHQSQDYASALVKGCAGLITWCHSIMHRLQLVASNGMFLAEYLACGSWLQTPEPACCSSGI